MSKHRQLAAIVFTDIVGYTTLIGKNEAKAMQYLHQSRSIQKQLVKEFDGIWLKEMGDGVLSTFHSASDAVYCALEIQEHLREYELELRIGIHLGEVLIENGDIYSEGVNIASRLQEIAEPGGIYLSEPVQKAIRGQSDIQTIYLGELQLKNVDYAVKTYALRADGLPPVINGAAKRLSGRYWAEIKRRSLHRVGIVYLCMSCIVLSLVPSLAILKLFRFEIMITLATGFLLAMLLAWKFEKGPGGFIRIGSAESWENPFSSTHRKPLTSNFSLLTMLITLVIINAFTLIEDQKAPERTQAENISIAILNFDDLSPTMKNPNFGDGLQEEILTQLAKNPKLDVKSRKSTLPFKSKKDKNIKEIGEVLDAKHVVVGSVRQVGDRMRVTAQLIEVENDRNIWSDAYNIPITDSVDVQHKIARIIASMVSNCLESKDADILG